MPGAPVGITDASPATGVAEIAAVSRADPNVTTTTTADPGTTAPTTTLAVTDRTFGGRVSAAATNFLIDVVGTSGIAERMLVTATGAGAGNFSVTRAQEGTAAVAHSVGAKVSIVVRVQQVEPIEGSKQVAFRGRAISWRIPGRAGTTGQKIFALHNATGSTVNVDVHKITVDCAVTVVKAVTVLPPIIRIYRFTAVPTNGTALTKNAEDSTLSSKVAVTAWNDASADGTLSGTALTIGAVTVGNQSGLLAQEFSARLITGAGFEMADRATFLEGEDESITLRALEGLCVHLDYVLATQNPATDFWTVGCRFTEWSQA